MKVVNDELCARIAAAGWKPRPGMAVRHPADGQWRIVDERGAACLRDVGRFCVPAESRSLRAAMTAGPDWTDLVTLLGLLADLPRWSLCLDESNGWWSCQRTARDDEAEGKFTEGPDRVQPLLLAWLCEYEKPEVRRCTD